MSELHWLKKLLRNMEVDVATTTVYSNSISAIHLANNSTTREISKHIDINCHFIREHVASRFLNLVHVPAKYWLLLWQGLYPDLNFNSLLLS